jgi:transcriptional regulator with XRE-family HTH domain
LKKYENKNNVIGNLIKEHRIKANLSKTEVSRQLQLHAVYIDRTELNRMEEGRMIIKDFELIALFKVLKIPFGKLSDLIE